MKKNNPQFIPFVQRCAQFEADKLKAAIPVSALPDTTLLKNPSKVELNPYKVAKNTLLAGYDRWRREEILRLEAAKDLDNRHYLTFVKEIAELGDKLKG